MYATLLLAATLLLGTPAAAPDGADVQVTLANGDVLRGKLLASSAQVVVLEHAVLGRLTLARGALAAPGAPPPPPAPTTGAPVVPAPAAAPPSPWSGSIDLGLNGSGGNTDEDKLRLSLKVRHDDAEGIWDGGVLYRRDESNGAVSSDQRFLEGRYSWKLPESDWGPFVQGSHEVDRFKDFDSRTGLGGGAAYTHRDDETALLISRYGLGFVQTSGGSDDGTTPEGILGLDYERQVDELTRFVSLLELLPDLSDGGEYRARADLALEWNLDATSEWMLRLGLGGDYDSTPGTAGSTDVEYYLSLGRRF